MSVEHGEVRLDILHTGASDTGEQAPRHDSPSIFSGEVEVVPIPEPERFPSQVYYFGD